MRKLLSVIAGILTVYELRKLIKGKATAQHPSNNSSPSLPQIKRTDNHESIKNSDGNIERRIEVEKYVEAVVSSSNRMRGVVIVLITTSVLSFIVNFRAQATWLDRRIEIRRAALNLFDGKQQPQRSELDDRLSQRAQDYLKLRGFDVHNNDDKALLLMKSVNSKEDVESKNSFAFLFLK